MKRDVGRVGETCEVHQIAVIDWKTVPKATSTPHVMFFRKLGNLLIYMQTSPMLLRMQYTFLHYAIHWWTQL